MGQIELIRDQKLSAVFFLIPEVSVETDANPVVKSLQKRIVDTTVLLNDQERVHEYLRSGPLLVTIMKEQAALQKRVFMKLLIRQ